RTVVFVCEHGAAKSVVAAAYFNRLAQERGLALHAIARGTNPDSEISPATKEGLAADGLKVMEKPTLLLENDLAQAEQIVAFCDLSNYSGKNLIRWHNVPAVSENYTLARDIIRAHLLDLLDKEPLAKKM